MQGNKKKSPSSDALPSDTEEKDFKTLKERYQIAKSMQINIIKSAPKHQHKIKNIMSGCVDWFKMRYFPVFNGLEASHTIKQGYTCRKYKTCPVCAIRRSHKVYHTIRDKIKALGLSESDFYLLTITVKNTYNLSEGLNTLRSFWKKLMQQRKNYKTKKIKNIENYSFGIVDGWISNTETTYNQNYDNWHPHMHILIVPKKEYLHLFEYEQIKHNYGSREGYFSNKFESYIANKLHEHCGSFMVDCRKVDNTHNGVAEVSKYLVKFSDLTPKQVWEVYEITKSMRLQSTGGIFRGVNLSPELEEDTEEQISRPFLDYIFKWENGKYKTSVFTGGQE